MKNFGYTARDTAGAMRQGSIHAVDRVAALQALKAQGLIPITVAESAARKEVFKLSGVPKTALLGGLAIAVLMIAALRMMPVRKPKAREQTPEMKKAEPVSAALPSPAVVSGGRATPATAQTPPIKEPLSELPVPAARVKPPLMQRPKQSGAAVPGTLTNQPPRHFSSGTEQVINMIVNTRPGNPPPPLLRLPQGENIEEILDRDIVLYDDDSAKTVEAKANVAYAKQLLKTYLKEGGTPEAFLEYYHGELTAAFNEWRAAQKYAGDLVRAGDKDGATRYMEEQNKKFAEKGIRPVKIFRMKE